MLDHFANSATVSVGRFDRGMAWFDDLMVDLVTRGYIRGGEDPLTIFGFVADCSLVIADPPLLSATARGSTPLPGLSDILPSLGAGLPLLFRPDLAALKPPTKPQIDLAGSRSLAGPRSSRGRPIFILE